MHRRLGIIVCLLIAAPVLAAGHEAPEGFTPLFDGKTLDGWKLVNTRGNFFVRDGVLVLDKGAGWLATEKTFADFELRLRYRFVTPGADSGVFFRASLEGSNWTSRGYQVQNMDNQTLGQIVGMGVKVKAEHKPDRVAKLKKPAGEWNDLAILVWGKHGEVALNGETVATSDDLQLTDGHIGLEAEGGVLEFERIDVRTPGSAGAAGTTLREGGAGPDQLAARLDQFAERRKAFTERIKRRAEEVEAIDRAMKALDAERLKLEERRAQLIVRHKRIGEEIDRDRREFEALGEEQRKFLEGMKKP